MERYYSFIVSGQIYDSRHVSPVRLNIVGPSEHTLVTHSYDLVHRQLSSLALQSTLSVLKLLRKTSSMVAR